MHAFRFFLIIALEIFINNSPLTAEKGEGISEVGTISSIMGVNNNHSLYEFLQILS